MAFRLIHFAVYTLVVFNLLSSILSASPLSSRYSYPHDQLPHTQSASLTSFPKQFARASAHGNGQLLTTRGLSEMAKNFYHNAMCMGSCTAKPIKPVSPRPSRIRQRPNFPSTATFHSGTWPPKPGSERPIFGSSSPHKSGAGEAPPAPAPLKIGTSSASASKTAPSDPGPLKIGTSVSKTAPSSPQPRPSTSSLVRDKGKGKILTSSSSSSSSSHMSSPEHDTPSGPGGPSGTKRA